MRDPRALAASYGVAVEFADLGAWGTHRLIAEYDPRGPVIRLNARVFGRERGGREVDLAIAHELYHHREAIGEVSRAPRRADRERAADTYAHVILSLPKDELSKDALVEG